MRFYFLISQNILMNIEAFIPVVLWTLPLSIVYLLTICSNKSSLCVIMFCAILLYAILGIFPLFAFRNIFTSPLSNKKRSRAYDLLRCIYTSPLGEPRPASYLILEEPILQGEECLITDLGRFVLSHSAHNNTNNQYPS